MEEFGEEHKDSDFRKSEVDVKVKTMINSYSKSPSGRKSTVVPLTRSPGSNSTGAFGTRTLAGSGSARGTLIKNRYSSQVGVTTTTVAREATAQREVTSTVNRVKYQYYQ